MTVTSEQPTKRVRRTQEEKAELVRQYGLVQTREAKREWLESHGLKPIQLAQWKSAAGKGARSPGDGVIEISRNDIIIHKEPVKVGRKRRDAAETDLTVCAVKLAPEPVKLAASIDRKLRADAKRTAKDLADGIKAASTRTVHTMPVRTNPWQPDESAAIRELAAEEDPIQSALLRRMEAANQELTRCRAALDALQGVGK